MWVNQHLDLGQRQKPAICTNLRNIPSKIIETCSFGSPAHFLCNEPSFIFFGGQEVGSRATPVLTALPCTGAPVCDGVVELVRELVGCNILLWHGATSNIDTDVHMNSPHSPYHKITTRCGMRPEYKQAYVTQRWHVLTLTSP